MSTETINVCRPSHVTLLMSDVAANSKCRRTCHQQDGQGARILPSACCSYTSHCAYLPYLHAPKTPLEVETLGDAAAMTLAYPFVRYEPPDTKSFHLLYTYLYRHDVNQLIGALLPSLPPILIQYILSVRRKCLPFQGEHRICMGASQDDDDSISSDSEERPQDGKHQMMRCRMLTRSHPHARLPRLGRLPWHCLLLSRDVAAQTQSRRFE
jgi:hypothetical protein